MKAVIYARYSSDNQREESIEGQLRECMAFAERKGYTVIKSYADRAISGKRADNRPEFQQMISDSARGEFDVIIVWKIDRFSRDKYDSVIYKSKLNKNGVSVISATEPIDDSPEGKLMESIFEGFSEYYVKDLELKTSRGMTENAIKGKFNGGHITYAVACAEYDTWRREDITNRYVKRGSKGIALIADDNGKARLRYVFDFSDTAARDERSKTPFFWSITPENENAVLKQLGTNAVTLDTAILEKAREIARNYSGDYLHDLMRETDGTFLDELDEFNVQSKFESLLETSIAYTVLTRCGYEAEMYIEPDDFRGIHEFNSIEAFKDWIFKDPDRREKLVNKYNEMFNSSRPREYDGSHITFSGMSPEIQLRTHQLNAIAHTMYGGNTLLAHQVGAGKTFEMVASAMESKRLGLCTKSLFVVPNHLTEQMGAEFLRLYPAANILVATKKDFEAKNRKRLCSKIATGDYDAVIIGHSQLEKIPVSAERQERMIRKQINEITEGIETLGRSQSARFSVKQLEKTKRNLEAKLKKLVENPQRDDVVTFEELGIDKMFVDEAHSFKNLFLYTKMRNVAGIQQTEAQKSADLYMKCQYLDEITGGKGIVFATGTPVSNSMTELYTMMRYLQADKLKEMGMHNFDAWAANFGEAVTAIELAPEGTGYRAKTRFSKFFNLPELINVFKECADIKTADMLNLPVPEAHFHNVVVKPSDIQKDMVMALSDRAKDIHDKKVQPEEDNMLKVTNDGRKIGLDQRLIDPLLPDDPNSKVNTCVSNVFDIYQKNDDKKSTQLVFCDFSTPKNDGSFNLYDDIRDKLIAKGVPKEEIAFIHEADSEAKKKELFSKVKQGKVRVLLGSTAKCGAGTNIQDKLIALHHLDCPWRPSDLEQREGRIIRQGNESKSAFSAKLDKIPQTTLLCGFSRFVAT